MKLQVCILINIHFIGETNAELVLEPRILTIIPCTYHCSNNLSKHVNIERLYNKYKLSIQSKTFKIMIFSARQRKICQYQIIYPVQMGYILMNIYLYTNFRQETFFSRRSQL